MLNHWSSKVVIVFSLLMLGCTGNRSDEFQIVYKNDGEGNALQGSKQLLIDHIRGGSDIKIGWGWKGETRSVEHLSTPIWILVPNESEVIVHLDPQVLSKTDWEELTANYADSTLLDQEWRVVLNTKGEFDAVWYDRIEGEVVRRVPQKHIMTWFAKGKSSGNQPFFQKD